MKKILVTGGTGYIGSHTVVELIRRGYEVVIFDNLCNSKEEVVGRIERITGVRPKFYLADMLDSVSMEKVFAENQFDGVIHFAGLKAVGESVQEPLMYYRNNVSGTINLLEKMREHGVKRFVFSSSATVYGNPGVPEYVETMTAGNNMANPYGETKHVVEEILKDLSEADGEFRAEILRYFNPVGAHPSGLLGEDPNGVPNNLMPVIMKVAKGDIAILSVYGDDYPTADGTGVRDYVHVVDLARAHICALEEILKDTVVEQVRTYNVGTGRGTSVREMIAMFNRATGAELPCRVVARRGGDLAEYYANPGKMRENLGFATRLSVEDAMRDTVAFLRNEGWI